MEYGPAPESDSVAIEFLEKHKRSFDLFINGKWKKPASKKYFDSVSPATKKKLAKISEANERSYSAYSKVANQIFAMIQDDDSLKSALGQVQLQELVLLNHLNNLVQLEKTLSTEALQANQVQYKKTRRALIGSVIAAFIVSLIISVVVIARVTASNRRIKHLATHDDLTGLANRRSFENNLVHTMSVAKRSDYTHGLLYLDFDRFKIINDSCGHHAGDQLLIQISALLRQHVQQEDKIFRAGGDEFAVTTKRDSMEATLAYAEELRECVQNYSFEYESQTFKNSVSIGVVEITGDEQDIETLLQDADTASTIAKQWGRNRVHLAKNDEIEVINSRNDIAGLQSIRRALDEDRLTLFHQQVHRITHTGTEMVHCEILLRIKSETGEMLSPAVFIPIAEKYNLMGEIDRWVISHVMEWVAKHQTEFKIPRLLINLSGLSFIDEDFLNFVIDELARNDVDPSQIAFEITETAAVENVSKANEFIDRLRAIGCRFALDDFGTGFSTFAYLKNLPIDYLKIDGSLVKNIDTDSVDREMVRAINEIGHVVGAKTIAEFVENDASVARLREMGVDYGQGYGLHKPNPLDSLLAHLKNVDLDTSEWRQAS